MPTQQELLAYFCTDLVAQYGADDPRVERRAQRRLELYLASRRPEVQALVASFPRLNESQRTVLATLLEP